jgi:hypothetical protein
MSSEIVKIAQYNGIQEYMHVDTSRPGDLIIETKQDCEPIIQRAKELSEQTPGKEWRHVACIPMFFIDEAVKKGVDMNDRTYWHRWLNDPANKVFRTWPGRIGPTHQI